MPDDQLSYKTSYRRFLPHIQLPGSSIFVTFRLAGSLPAALHQELKAEAQEEQSHLQSLADVGERAQKAYLARKRYFGRWDQALDADTTGPQWLKNPQIAQIVTDSLHYLDGRLYSLDSFCIMSNHVHVLFTPMKGNDGADYALSKIMHSLKGYTAGRANRALGRSGQFWQHESYDHIVRDPEEFLRIRRYILNNPVKARIVQRWKEWPYSYCCTA